MTPEERQMGEGGTCSIPEHAVLAERLAEAEAANEAAKQFSYASHRRRAEAAEARVAALTEALREIAEPMPTEDGDWGATFDWHDLAMKRRDIARAALAAVDRPEGTTPLDEALLAEGYREYSEEGRAWSEGTIGVSLPERGFAGTPPHLQPNGGSCTCSRTYRGDGTDLGRSRCPIHGPGTTPQEGNA